MIFECNWYFFFLPCLSDLKQYLDMNILSPVVNVTEHALDKDSSTIDSNKIIKEEGKDLHGTSEISGSLELLLELQKKSDNPEKIEVEKDVTKFNLKTIIFYSSMC